MATNGFISTSLDLSDWDGNTCIPLYKVAGAKKNLDVICFVNYPAFLNSFTSAVTTGLDCKGFTYGLSEFLTAKYGISFPFQFTTISQIETLFHSAITQANDEEVRDYLLQLKHTLIAYARATGASTIDIVEAFKRLYASTTMKIVQDVWDATKHDNRYVPTLTFCEGGVASKMAFHPHGKFVVVNDDLRTYKKSLSFDLKPQCAKTVLSKYVGKKAYVDVNGTAAFFENDLFKDIDVVGVYAMNGVEMTKIPFTLYVPEVTSRLPYATMNWFYHPEKGMILATNMSQADVPINMSTNNEVNEKLKVKSADLWDKFKLALDDKSPAYHRVSESFHAYYKKPEEVVKPFDLLSALHLVKDVLCGKEGHVNNGRFSLFADDVFGINIVGNASTTIDHVADFVRHCNDEKWNPLNDIMFNNDRTFKAKITKTPIASLTRINDTTAALNVFQDINEVSVSNAVSVL